MEGENRITGTVDEAPMQRARRCHACGGLNPPGAQWCGQCHTRFDAPRQEPTPAETATEADVSQATAASESPPPPPRDGTSGGDGAFQVTDEGINWTCSVCDTVNDLAYSLCSVCGAPFARTVLPPEEKPQRDPNMAAMLSLFVPGAGHAYLGLWGQGIARAVISFWVFMVVLVSALQRGAGSSTLIMVVFGLVMFGLWGVAAHDAYREARDEGPLVILKGKLFFYLVLGLLLLLVALLMTTIVKAQS